jgi:ABC-2 type transport system permease protein
MRVWNWMPVLLNDLRMQLRGSRAALLLTVYVGLGLIAMRLVYNTVAGNLNNGLPMFNAQIGQSLFIGQGLTLQALVVFLAPAATVNSVSAEYERRTYDLLSATPVASVHFLIGKLLAGMAFIALLLVAALPLFSVVLLFGGVGTADVVRVLVVLALTALTGSVLGLFCSALTRRTFSATLLCYALLVAIVGGTLFAANVWSVMHALQPAPPVYGVANPLTAMASALGQTRPPEAAVSERLSPLVLLSLLSQGTVVIQEGERIALPIYRATLGLYGMFSLTAIWISLHLLERRWQVRRYDLVLLLLVVLAVVAGWVTRDWWLAGLSGAA